MCQTCGSNSCSGQCQNGWPFNRPAYNPPYTRPFSQQCVPIIPPLPLGPCTECNPCAQQGCLQSITTDCVTTVKLYNCFQTASGTSLTTVLDKIDALICAITPSCKIQISADDNCCDYLGSKITSSSLNITTVTNTGTGCQTLNIEAVVDSCAGKVLVDSADACCDYLQNKIISDNLTITTVTGEGGCVSLKLNAPTIPDLSCLGKVQLNSTASCHYLADIIVAGAVAPQINGTGSSQTLSFVEYTATYNCIVVNSTGTPLPISSNSNGNVVCTNTYYDTRSFPAPSQVGIPIVGLGQAWSLMGQSPNSGPPIVSLGNLTFAADQGVTGTYACSFTLPSGTYDISLSYNITNAGTRIGETGFVIFILQDQAALNNTMFPCKEVVSCAAENRLSSSFYISGVTIPSGGKTFLLRMQNSLGTLAGSANENLTLAFKKVG